MVKCVKDLTVAVQGFNPRQVPAVAQIGSLAWDLPYTEDVAKKKKKRVQFMSSC